MFLTLGIFTTEDTNKYIYIIIIIIIIILIIIIIIIFANMIMNNI